MAFKFEKLEVWQMSLEYIDTCYAIAEKLPASENFNLASQIRRAATSINLNIAEGSTGQTDIEQARFLGLAIRSLIETVACQHIISRREYWSDKESLRIAYQKADSLLNKLIAMRKAINPAQGWLREDKTEYLTDGN
ncbi:MAG: four helix bundle protein [Anaerolineae bacterium]